MHYCRFQNTLGDLEECKEALDMEGMTSLSEAEQQAAEILISTCIDIAVDYAGLIDREVDEV
jgi:hypothetical protein